jgi:hypothetical protein
MKAIKYLIGLNIVLFVAASCNKKLDVLPQNSLPADQIKTSADVTAILFGGYSGLQSSGGFGENFIMASDLLAADSQVNFVGTFYDYLDLQVHTAINTNAIAGNMWPGGYNVVNIANTVLDKITLVDSGDTRKSVQGEALFLRGTSFFYLTGLFAKPYSDGAAANNPGISLVLKPTYVYDSSKNSPNKPARATVQQSYTQIIADLQAAIGLLPKSNDDGRATVYSAEAMLSRVYMSMGDYPHAAQMAAAVINSGNFGLGTYASAFNHDGYGQEDIFAVLTSNQSNPGTSNAGLITFYDTYPTGRGDAQVDPAFFDIFDDANDVRGAFTYKGKSISGTKGNYTNKWSVFFKTIPVVRLAEMYLTRGEANLRAGAAGTGDDPVADINTVRERAGAADLGPTLTVQDFVEERFRELAFEGDRYWTLKRNKLNFSTGFGYDNNKLILPIPQRELDANPNLVQNTGY